MVSLFQKYEIFEFFEKSSEYFLFEILDKEFLNKIYWKLAP